MVNQKIVDYIKKEESDGFTENQLRDSLIGQGFNTQEVDEAIKFVNQSVAPAVNSAPTNNNEGAPKQDPSKDSTTPQTASGIKKRNPYLIVLLSIITFSLYFLYWLISTTNELRKNTKSAPNPWLLLLSIIPLVNIIVMAIYLYKYSKSIGELTKYNSDLLFLLYLLFAPAGMIISQIELNKISS